MHVVVSKNGGERIRAMQLVLYNNVVLASSSYVVADGFAALI